MQKKLYVRYVALFALAICTASSVKAAEYTFQSSGGDLATPANWGATALTSGDTGAIGQGGTYTLSDNLTLSQLKIATTSRCIFDFTGKNNTLKLSADNYPIAITEKVDAHLKGGVWDFSGKDFRGQKDNCVFWLRDGAKITNAGHFYNCYNVKNWDVRLYEASKIECENYTLARNGQGVSLVVADGSAIEANATFASDRNSSAGVMSYNQIQINGANSKISSQDFVVGFTSSRNTLNISDGGIVHASGRLTLGASSGTAISSTNTIRIADGILTVEKEFFTGANSYDNVFTATNSVVNIATVSNLGARTVFDFQNCTVGIGNLRPFMRNGGRFRIGGSRATLTISGDTANPFASDLSANNDNHLVFDDGVNITLTGNCRWMSASSNCTVSVSNGAKWTVDGNFYIGYNTANGLADLAASQGTVNATYEETQDGADKAKLAVQNMKTTAAELVNNFLEKYSPQIEKAIEAVTKTLDKLAPKVEAGIQWLIDNLPLIEAGVVGIATAFAAWKITGIITAVTTALAGMSAAEVVAAAKTWLLNAAMAANPIGLVVTAIAALVAAFVVLWNKSEKFRNFWKGLWKEIKATVEKYIGAVVDFFKNAWERIKLVWSVVSAFFEAIWNGIKAIFEPVIDWFKEKFENAWNAIKTVWLFVHTFFEEIWNNIKAIFEPVIDWFKEKFETAWNTIKAIWTVVTEFFGDIWNGIKETFSSVGDWFSEKFETAVNNIKAVFSVIKNFFSGVWDGIKSVFGGVADWFHDVFSKAWQKVKDVFSTGGKIFTGIKDGIVNAFKTVVNGIIRGINKVIKIPFEKINSMLDVIQGIEVLGVEPFKWLSGRLGIPQIPELEKGGIVKNRSFIAGENGEEAIVPLEKNTGGLRKIATLLADEMQRSGNVIKGNNSNTVNNYNFNQTNNSPKSLSRYDIYRQTRNLINAAKGV